MTALLTAPLEALVAGLLAALVTAVLLVPARRSSPGRSARAAGLDGAAAASRAGRGSGAEVADIGPLLVEVATLLRAGATPERAWSRCLGRLAPPERCLPGADGVPPALLDLAAPAPEGWLPSRVSGRWRWRPPWPWRAADRERHRTAAACVPGAAAACRLTRELGAPLAEVLESVAASVADSGRAEGSRAAALSGPRTTARLLAALPVAGLGLGALVGAQPATVLLDGGAGSLAGAIGLGLLVLGHRLTGRLVAAARGGADGVDEALVLDLAAAALASGASVPGCLIALGASLDREPLRVAGRALLLGADWDEAWREARASGPPGALEASLRPGWEDGASPAPLLRARATALRDSRQSRDEEAAQRLAVRLVVPLGMCHLPAFVLLGIVPVVAGLGLDLLVS